MKRNIFIAVFLLCSTIFWSIVSFFSVYFLFDALLSFSISLMFGFILTCFHTLINIESALEFYMSLSRKIEYLKRSQNEGCWIINVFVPSFAVNFSNFFKLYLYQKIFLWCKNFEKTNCWNCDYDNCYVIFKFHDILFWIFIIISSLWLFISYECWIFSILAFYSI